MKEEKSFLPIGTVCRLKNGQKDVMIMGFCPMVQERCNEMFDYSGCLYPEGVITSEINMVFNNSQIEKIVYMGLINEEEKEFKKKLIEELKKYDESPNIENQNSNNLSQTTEESIKPITHNQPTQTNNNIGTIETLNLNQ